MFAKILIANRGEIACRVIRTARRLGIATVAVYSEADDGALHARMADEAVAIGPPAVADSYLVMERIIAAARETGAEAVHPGYGFLSENADFARTLDAAGIAFIGPGPEAVAAMGDKIESKKLAEAAGVNTVPGRLEALKDAKAAVKVAREVGYPVMLKASAGGGGKGMRIARTDDEARDGFRSARNEARSSFGDDRVFIEKFIEQPRHIEIQVLADAHGNVIHLGERECSIQRRHQKVIEEAPSPAIDATTREAMGAQAVALAKAVDYCNAGTVEFISDQRQNFYFLEMNTRLQVEHPVTEVVTGIDLVEQQIRVAAGETLRLTQDDIRFDGWAIEARIYAEDPLRHFVPSIGRLVRYLPPPEGDGVRLDSGVEEGSEVTLYYDPMIAKLIAHGPTRADAVARLAGALDAYYIRGVSHNAGFLAAVLATPRFAEGRLSTAFIDEEFPDGFTGTAMSAGKRMALVAVAAAVHHRLAARDATFDLAEDTVEKGTVAEPCSQSAAPAEWVVALGGEQVPVVVRSLPGGCEVTVEGEARQLLFDWAPGAPLFQGRLDGHDVCVQIARDGVDYVLSHAGVNLPATVVRPRVAELAALMPVKEPPDLSRYLLSPMPGLLVLVAVEEGWEVEAGQELAVVEAMKMENILRAEQNGVIAKIHAQPGDSLAADQVILEFE
jgi:propionyl-CoA carboxylase alpha chain